MALRTRDLMMAALLGGAFLLGCGTAQAEPEIGSVFQRNFMGATGARLGGTSEHLYFNTIVYAEETVSTDGGGSTALRFADGTKLQVGANSTVVLDRFVYDPESGVGEAVLSFSKGVFRFVSGELREEAMRLETPSATLTIRGTRFILAVADSGNVDVWVIDGAVEAVPRAGAPGTAHAGQSLQVVAGTPGVAVVDGRTAPHDPAIDADLSLAGRRGTGDGERTSGSGGISDGGDGDGGGDGGNSGGGSKDGSNSGGGSNNAN